MLALESQYILAELVVLSAWCIFYGKHTVQLRECMPSSRTTVLLREPMPNSLPAAGKGPEKYKFSGNLDVLNFIVFSFYVLCFYRKEKETASDSRTPNISS